MASDLQGVRDFVTGNATSVATSSVLPTDSIWSAREFRSNSATSKMLAIMLAHERPVDLVTGQQIDAGKSLSWGNDKEYHHFFPRDYLRGQGVTTRRSGAVANIVLLTSVSNIRISNKPPSVYLSAIGKEVGEEELRSRLAKLLISDEAYEAAMADDYAAFLRARSRDLQARALALVGGTTRPTSKAADIIDDVDEESPA